MLAGREAEQRRIDQLLQQAMAGSSGVLVLRGDPGIGKTTLIDYAASRAGSMRVLRATGIEAENDLGFAGLYSLLRPVADYLKGLPEPHAAALRCALGLETDKGPPDRLAVAGGTHGLLTTVAEVEPLLILVDDLHWLDPGSQEALLFALHRLDQDAIACLLTLRPGTAAPAGLPCQEVTGLDRDAAERLVEAVAGTKPAPETVRRLYAETGGNPLALVELAAALTAGQLQGAELPGPPLEPGAAIRQRFAARLDRLSPSARTMLVVAAAAGRCFPAEVKAAAALLGVVDGQALGEAEAADMMRLTSTGVEFSHPLVRSVAYHVAVPAQRRAAHLAVAEALTGRDAERAAWHLAAAATGPDDQAAVALDAAADLAVATGAPLAAAAAWERAAALSSAAEPAAARRAEAAEAALKGGDLDRARRLTETLPAAGSLAHRARMLAVRGRLQRTTGQTAVVAWGIGHPYYSALPDLIEAYARSGAADQARALLPQYLAQVPGDHPLPAARAARCQGIVAASDFDRHFQEAISLHERNGVVFQHARTRLAYGERLRRAQRRRDARVQLRAAAEIFDQLDARPWAERARAELRASGETLTVGGDGGEQLTAQELQIALLVTEGQTNAEVGRALFLSTRTVEFHLSRAYRKLGVSSRTELTRRFVRAGTTPG